MSEETNQNQNQIPVQKSLVGLLNIASSQQTFENMQVLVNQNEYTIAGETYKRKMLKPRDIVELNKLQIKIDKAEFDPEKRMELVKEQAKICLEGLTDQKWEETDAGLMEIVVGACLLISKGFRKV